MGKALRQLRRKGKHQRLDEENILLKQQLEGMQKALGNLHATMLRFSLGGNWACITHVRSDWNWLRKKPKDPVPEYVWMGAGNPEKAAHDTMIACFGKEYKERARAAFMEAKKAQEEKDAEVSMHNFPGDSNASNGIGGGE